MNSVIIKAIMLIALLLAAVITFVAIRYFQAKDKAFRDIDASGIATNREYIMFYDLTTDWHLGIVSVRFKYPFKDFNMTEGITDDVLIFHYGFGKCIPSSAWTPGKE